MTTHKHTEFSSASVDSEGANTRADRQELVNRIEATLRGLEYVETLPDGSFKAWNWSMEALEPTHIDGIRHERSVYTLNLRSRYALAIRKCSGMAAINQLLQ